MPVWEAVGFQSKLLCARLLSYCPNFTPSLLWPALGPSANHSVWLCHQEVTKENCKAEEEGGTGSFLPFCFLPLNWDFLYASTSQDPLPVNTCSLQQLQILSRDAPNFSVQLSQHVQNLLYCTPHSESPTSFPATSEFGLYRTNPFSKFLNVNSLPLPLKETIFPRVFCSSYICSISVSLFTLLVTYQLSLNSPYNIHLIHIMGMVLQRPLTAVLLLPLKIQIIY